MVEVESGSVQTVDAGGTNLERGGMGLTWSPDSRWLAYAKTFPNNFRRIVAWSSDEDETMTLTDRLADAVSPSWDRDGRHLYFLASTNLALSSGWANTSSIKGEPEYGAYVMVLRADDPTPFELESDEEPEPETDEQPADSEDAEEPSDSEDEGASVVEVRIDTQDIQRRIIALPLPVANYRETVAGQEGSFFIRDGSGTVHKFELEERKSTEFLSNANSLVVSADGEHLLYRSGGDWHIAGTSSPPESGDGRLDMALRMKLDRSAEWQQMFDEAWRYERDYFYDPGMHGNDWDEVRARYSPLVPFVRHRADLTYLLDQMNGEMAVGHSFVFGGDYPEVDDPSVGLLGADLVIEGNAWRISRIYTYESWNPSLTAPLDVAGLNVEEGSFITSIAGRPLDASQDPYELLDGTAGVQTELGLSETASGGDAWTITVEPISNENALRRRAWVEDNRRRVDELSDGKLAYIWVPNTGTPGLVSFDRYYFAQQDKLGAVIDERHNGGGNLDDYMVDLTTRKLRAAITNEVPNGNPIRLPAGIHGPKVLLINEMAGSGGDFFPWVFRQQNAGKLIGKRTWGGLVKSSVHYALVDGGALTAPDNAVYDPIAGEWIAENVGIAPDIEVEQDAAAVAAGRDPQLERAVEELLGMISDAADIPPPCFLASSEGATSRRSDDHRSLEWRHSNREPRGARRESSRRAATNGPTAALIAVLPPSPEVVALCLGRPLPESVAGPRHSPSKDL